MFSALWRRWLITARKIGYVQSWLILALIYFLVVTGSYGVEFFMPSILERWYSLKFDALTWLVILPPLLAVFGQLFVGWSSDRKKERWLHTAVLLPGGQVLVAAGKGDTDPIAGMERYDPAANRWAASPR